MQPSETERCEHVAVRGHRQGNMIMHCVCAVSARILFFFFSVLVAALAALACIGRVQGSWDEMARSSHHLPKIR